MSAGLLPLLLLLLTLTASPSLALGPADGTGITLYGGDHLSPSEAATLRGLLTALPVSMYPHLQMITVDGAKVPETNENCDISPFPGPCQMHIWSGGETFYEDPFPSDAPDHATASRFYQVGVHELGHQVSFWTWYHRVDWETKLIAEAGCEPRHYLRSMFPRCYFVDFPQEFIASVFNQWMVCSDCLLKLSLARWDAGIAHPLNQAIFLLWLYGSTPPGDTTARAGQVLTYREHNGEPAVTIWTVRPWQCGGDVTIAGPTFALTVRLDERCRVTAVGARDGI